MGIKITLTRAQKTVDITDFESLEELLFSSGKEYLEKPATSLLMFRRIIAYAELIAKSKFDHEEVLKHLYSSLRVYNSISEHESIEPSEIESFVEDRLKEDSFNELYGPIIEEITEEIFKIFASGSVAHAKGYTEITSNTDFLGVMYA